MIFLTTHPDTDEPLEVEVDYYPGCRGLRDRYGAPQTPDEDAEIEICKVWRDGKEIDFENIEEALIELAFDALREHRSDYALNF